ncbi:MAG: hypothetical protein AB1473_22260 [Thermodesulfobacteriota bacterium]
MLTSKISPVKHVRECGVERRAHELSIHAGYWVGEDSSHQGKMKRWQKMEDFLAAALDGLEYQGTEASHFRFEGLKRENVHLHSLLVPGLSKVLLEARKKLLDCPSAASGIVSSTVAHVASTGIAEEDMTEEKPKWTMERIRNEVYDARTKLFVVAKVLETGLPDPAESPEWVLVIKPLLKEIIDHTKTIQNLMKDEKIAAEKQ